MNMGARIKELLQERGWKQIDLLERVPEMEAGSLSALINRDSRFSEHALGIANAFGVSLNYLLFGSDRHTSDSSQRDVGSDLNAQDVCELLALYGACDPAGREFIKATARARVEAIKTSTDKRKRGA